MPKSIKYFLWLAVASYTYVFMYDAVRGVDLSGSRYYIWWIWNILFILLLLMIAYGRSRIAKWIYVAVAIGASADPEVMLTVQRIFSWNFIWGITLVANWGVTVATIFLLFTKESRSYLNKR
jgi:hypothetical protein